MTGDPALAAPKAVRVLARALVFILSGSLLASSAFANGFPHFAISLDQLLALLKSPDPQHRLEAATSLGIRRERSAVSPLLELIEQEEEAEGVKVEAVEALGAIREGVPVGRLVSRLEQESSAKVRGQIVDVLGDLDGLSAAEAVTIALVSDPAREVRARAAQALGRLRPPGAFALLVGRLHSETAPENRAAIFQGLGQLGDREGTPTLIAALVGERDPLSRKAAALALGKLGDPRAVAPLIAVVAERSDPILRQAAILALGQLRHPDAVRPLADLLGDQDIVTVALAVRSLGEIGHASAVEPLLALGRRTTSESERLARAGSQRHFSRQLDLLTMRIEMITALGRLADGRAWPLFESALTAKLPPQDSAEGLRLRERTYELRRVATVALALMPDPRRVQRWVRTLLKDLDPKIRAEAARSVGLRGDPSGFAWLRPALRDRDPEVRWEAVRSVGLIKAQDRLPALLQALGDPVPRVALEAIRALEKLDDPRAIPLLERLSKSGDEELQEAAAAALAQLRR